MALSSVKGAQVDSIGVAQGIQSSWTYNLNSEQTFSGSISIIGLSSTNDIGFYVTDSQGATLVNSGLFPGVPHLSSPHNLLELIRLILTNRFLQRTRSVTKPFK
jgi:hypothetical protein